MFREPRFEWDAEKNRTNIEKHGFGFELAQTVFEDPDMLIQYDRFEDGEDRWHALGAAAGEILLLVVHVNRRGENDEDVIRILSARRAERPERARYRAFNAESGRSSVR